VPQLKTKLQQLKTDNPDLGVVLKGDDEVDYQVMVNVMDTLRQLDIVKMGLATD
jgi:biopolymer transport protein ExbD